MANLMRLAVLLVGVSLCGVSVAQQPEAGGGGGGGERGSEQVWITKLYEAFGKRDGLLELALLEECAQFIERSVEC